MAQAQPAPVEWPTLALVVCCYLGYGLGITVFSHLWLPLGIVVAAFAVTLHSSLQHEIIHGHPFRRDHLNAALVFPALGLLIPFGRFRDQHLAHHMDCRLTDPYDDPETNYLDEGQWERLPVWVQAVLNTNNTLLGRMLIGPLVAQVFFVKGDLRDWADPAVRKAWAIHVPAMALVLAVLWAAPMPLWAGVLAAYLGHSILKIRTFAEHRAHEHTASRSVIIEDRGPLAFMFLNNNLHVVHHMHPRVAWYRLPELYRSNRDRYLARNEGYLFSSYWDLFRAYAVSAKDPVPHPLWKRNTG